MFDGLTSIIDALKIVVVGGLVLGILVFVHELGHFIVAKLCHIRVLAFSLGFGKPLVKKQVGDTEYRLSAIPFGGYVHMAGEHPEDESVNDPDEFTSKPIWQRILVGLGGPGANLIFSLFILWIVFMAGEEKALYLENTTVGAVQDSSAAAIAGISAGDSIIAVDGDPVSEWQDIYTKLASNSGEHEVTIVSGTEQRAVSIQTPNLSDEQLPTMDGAGLLPPAPARIGTVMPESPAAQAGFAADDSVIAINGRHIHSWYELSEVVAGYDSTNGALTFMVLRDGSRKELMVTPRYSGTDERYQIGVAMAMGQTRRIQYGPIAAIGKSFERSGEYAMMIFTVVKKLVTGEVSPKQLAGPIGIVQMSGTVALLEGVLAILNLLALVGVNLAVLNLLPLVITDGGMILFLLVEAVRGKPLPLKQQLIINRIAIAFFIALFLYVTFNDIARIPQLFRMMGR